MFERIEETPLHLGQCNGSVPGGGRFRVFDHGAHVTEWSPSPTPVVFTSAQSAYAADRAIRGGIPVCFPWFAAGPGGRATPSHGPARLTRWHLDKAVTADGTTTLDWRLTDAEIADAATSDAPPSAPRGFEVHCQQRFGTELEVDLRVRNTGQDSMKFEVALHTYFHVGDVTQVTLEGLRGSDYLDKVTRERASQREPLRLVGETDRVYASTADVTIVDPALGRRITVAKEGSRTTVVWNPWAEKAAQLDDLGDDEWRRFVCVETANVAPDDVHLASGESHVMRLRVRVDED